MDEKRYVVITTDRRLVMFGAIVEHDRDAKRVVLTEARNCLYWGSSVRGVFGLASHGPDMNSRVGRPVQRIEIEGVTSITDCTPEAVQAWEAEPWRG